MKTKAALQKKPQQSVSTVSKKVQKQPNTVKKEMQPNVRTTDYKKMEEIILTDPDSLTREEFLFFQSAVGYRRAIQLLNEGKRRKQLRKMEGTGRKVRSLQQNQEQETNGTKEKKVIQKQKLSQVSQKSENEPVQKRASGKNTSSSTSLPKNLKSGLEKLSGIDLSDVSVHKNSDKPQQVGALAYTQGNNIHLAPGQEKHLPHEGWHAVQQKQGRVAPTLQMKSGTLVNDDAGLEKEADIMGSKAVKEADIKGSKAIRAESQTDTIQLKKSNNIQQRNKAAVPDNPVDTYIPPTDAFPMYIKTVGAGQKMAGPPINDYVKMYVKETMGNYQKIYFPEPEVFAANTALTAITTYLYQPKDAVQAILIAAGVLVSGSDYISSSVALYRSCRFSFYAAREGYAYDPALRADVKVYPNYSYGELTGGYDNTGHWKWIISSYPSAFSVSNNTIYSKVFELYTKDIYAKGVWTSYSPDNNSGLEKKANVKGSKPMKVGTQKNTSHLKKSNNLQQGNKTAVSDKPVDKYRPPTADFPMYTKTVVGAGQKMAGSPIYDYVKMNVKETMNNYHKILLSPVFFASGTLLTIISAVTCWPMSLLNIILTAAGVLISSYDYISSAITLYKSAIFSFDAAREGYAYDPIQKADVKVLPNFSYGKLSGGYDNTGHWRWIISSYPSAFSQTNETIYSKVFDLYTKDVYAHGKCTLYFPD